MTVHAPGCRNPAGNDDWFVEPSVRLIDAEAAGSCLWIGEWRCPGERRPFTKEVSRHVALELQREGVHLRELGRQRRVIDAATVAIHPANDEYRMSSPSDRPQRSTILLLRGALLDELGAPRVPHTGSVDAHAALLHRRLLIARDPLAREEAALALAVRLLGAAHVSPRGVGATRRGRTVSTPPASWRLLAEGAQHLLATRHAEALTLGSLAQLLGTSPFHLSRVFRAVVGETVHRHLVRLRLRAALLALDGDGRGLAEVALAAGFSSHSHFTSAFRAEYGVPPSRLDDATLKRAARSLR